MSEIVPISAELIASLCPVRDDKGHKGTFGTALICAGSEDMTGAQTLATESALRSGVGMVRVFAERGSMYATRVNCPCAMYSSYEGSIEDTVKKAAGLLERAGCVLIGPGLDPDDKRNAALLILFIKRAKHLVIDASALNILAREQADILPLLEERQGQGLAPAILTPHVGEFKRLAGETGEEQCVSFASKYNCILILKDHNTFISCSGGRSFRLEGNNSGMSKGGSGDVLAGLITGLTAQGMKEEDSAISAVYIHSAAGRAAAADLGKRSMLPCDIPAYFTDAFEEVMWEAKGE